MGVASALMRAFESSGGRTVHLAELVKATGFEEAVIQRGVVNLRKRPEWERSLAVIVRGQAWRYAASPAMAARVVKRAELDGLIFEAIGVSQDGDLILQCVDGRLFRACPL